MPKTTTENVVSEAVVEPVKADITLDDFANRKHQQRRDLLESIAAFCHAFRGEAHRTFEEWDALFHKFMNSPAE